MWTLFFSISCSEIHALIIDNYPLDYLQPEGLMSKGTLQLEKVAEGFVAVTDVQFFPGSNKKALIAQKEGIVSVLSIADQSVRKLATIPVKTRSEQGVLGLAFHPDFESNRLIYIHLTPPGDSRTEISEWRLEEEKTLIKVRIVLELVQPYANHNGGQIQFGPEGYLYVGLGDGGWRDDPHNNGQDFSSILGTIVRLDVNGAPYKIPKDNPFVHNKEYHPLIWAYGLRNPWRFSFLEDGRIITGDVGQNAYEEVSIISKGDNLGWNTKEGFHCFRSADCESNGLVDPVFEYEHALGASITGGYVVLDGSSGHGQYIFGDFTSGRIWMFNPTQTPILATELMQSGLNISTFARSANGMVYVADYGTGTLYKMVFSKPN